MASMSSYTIYTLFLDTVGSTTASTQTRDRHLSRIATILDEYSDRQVYCQQLEGDAFHVEFSDGAAVMNAARHLLAACQASEGTLMIRGGIDVGQVPPDNDTLSSHSTRPRSPYQAIARARRIADLSPNGYVLCSLDASRMMTSTGLPPTPLSRPKFVKLKSFVRPVGVCVVGDRPTRLLPLWQAKRREPGSSPFDFLRAGRVAEIGAYSLVWPLWYVFRDRGRYASGRIAFQMLNAFAKLSRWIELDYHTAIGLSDETMLLRQPRQSLRWARYVCHLASRSQRPDIIAMARYNLGHCLAHHRPSTLAADLLKEGFEIYEEEMASPRMAAWAAVYLGRCLRGLGRMTDAEDWILAS